MKHFEITLDESGLGEFSSRNDTENNIIVTEDAGLAGSRWGLEVTTDDAETFSVSRAFTESESTFNLRIYLDPNGSSLSTTEQTNWIRVDDSGGGKIYFYLRKDSGGDHEYFFLVGDDVGGFHSVPADWEPISDAEHFIEIGIVKGTGANGVISVFQDGDLVGTSSGRDLDGLEYTGISIGLLATTPGTTGDTVFFDEIVASSDGYIGPRLANRLDAEQGASSGYSAALGSLSVELVGTAGSGTKFLDAWQMMRRVFNQVTGKVRVVR